MKKKNPCSFFHLFCFFGFLSRNESSYTSSLSYYDFHWDGSTRMAARCEVAPPSPYVISYVKQYPRPYTSKSIKSANPSSALTKRRSISEILLLALLLPIVYNRLCVLYSFLLVPCFLHHMATISCSKNSYCCENYC